MMCSRRRYNARHGQRDEKHSYKQESNDKFRAGGENEGKKKESGCSQQMEGLWDG